jgi:hypothetical protein
MTRQNKLATAKAQNVHAVNPMNPQQFTIPVMMPKQTKPIGRPYPHPAI